MHHVISCVICISSEVEYPEKKGSYKNYTKEVTLSFQIIFAMQSKERSTKFRCIGTLTGFCINENGKCRDLPNNDKKWTILITDLEGFVRNF